jgi:3-isopropylmalate dehydrogenase
MSMKIADPAGDGIGTEIVAQAVQVLQALGAAAWRWTPAAGRRRRLRRARPPAARGHARSSRRRPTPSSSAPVGDWKYDTPRARASARAGDPRACASTWASSPTCARRCATQSSTHASSAEARGGGGPGHPHHPRADRRHLLRPAARHAHGRDGHWPAPRAFDTMRYSRRARSRRIAHVAFEAARKRAGARAAARWTRPTCWRPSSSGATSSPRCTGDYPDVELAHMYVDNAAMQLVRAARSSST